MSYVVLILSKTLLTKKNLLSFKYNLLNTSNLDIAKNIFSFDITYFSNINFNSYVEDFSLKNLLLCQIFFNKIAM